jgi:Flp pilus assembly protein TadG
MLEQLRKFLKEQRGFGTATACISMMALLGAAALAVDIGNLAVTKGELQRAVDAGAMAGARALWPTALPMMLNPPSNPSCVSAKDVALNTATHVSNKVGGQILTAADLTIEVGNYDNAARSFTPKGDCTLTSNAVRIKAKKQITNIFFAGVFGVDYLQPKAEAVGSMSFAKAVGKGTLPMAINKMFVVPGNEIFINFVNDPNDNAGWFADPPDKTGAPTFQDYIVNESCPPLKIGDVINLQNGQDTSCLQALADELKEHPGGWDTFLPVVNTDKFNHPEPITGFVPFRITEVSDTGSTKGVRGKVVALSVCKGALPGSDVNCGTLAPVKVMQ